MRRLDAALFGDAAWFAIGEDNRRVGGVVVASLDAGLALVGRGDVATIVGRLRDEVVVVDVDMAGETGHAVAEAVTHWCADEGLWSLVRPSGGADGRSHVFVAHQGRLDALTDVLERLRGSLRASRTSIDLRTTVRPLSAPHRTGTETKPFGALTEALSSLQQHSWAQTILSPASRGRTGDDPGRPRPSVAALTPHRRREKRPLPPVWQTFLDTGVRPKLRPPGPSAPAHTRSTWEAIATATMLRAGWSAEQAWEAIEDAHPTAMDHARQNKSRWVQWVWNRAVQNDDDFTPPRRRDLPLEAAIGHARAQLRTLAWSLPARQRAALRRVGDAVLDRMERVGSTRVPVPERDLILDTGLTDRKTIRTQLRRMDGLVGSLDKSTFDPVTKRAESSFEFSIPPAPSLAGGLSQIPPPSRHTPSPAELPEDSPTACSAILRALRELAEPGDLAVVAQQAQMTTSATDPPSLRQARTLTEALTVLVRMGLAWCTEDGQWFARDAFDEGHARAGQDRRAALEASIAGERAAYRAPREGAWSVARAAALKAQRAREKAWWANVSPDERHDRQQRWRAKFGALSVTEQASVKSRLTERDFGAGIDAAARHDTWLDALTMDGYLHRSVERATWFAALPGPLRIAYARAWQEHRTRYGIAWGTPLAGIRRDHAAALPRGSDIRDAAFWADQLDLSVGGRDVG